MSKIKMWFAKKSVKIACVVVGVIVALLLLVALLISPVAKHVVEKNSKEWIGRQILMDELSINIFTGSLETDGFHFKEKDDVTDFVRLDTFKVAINPFKLLTGEIHIRYITLVEPTVRLVQYDSTFNFTDLTELGGDDEEVEDEDSDDDGWALGIYNIRLAHGSVSYKDETVDSEWNLKNLNLFVPGVYFSGKSTDAGISFGFAEGGTLTTQAKYDMEKSVYDVKVQLKGLALDNFLPYVTDALNVSSLGGALDADVHLVGSADVPMDVDITGNVSVNGLDMKDADEADVVSVNQITAGIERINPQHGVCTIDSVVVDGVDTHFDMYADYNNFDKLMKETSADSSLAVEVTEEDTAAPMVVLIKKILLKNSKLTFTDNTLRGEPFRYELTNVNAELKDFNPSGTENNCDLTLETQGGGNVRMKWHGSMEGLQNQRLTLFLKNVDMKAFTPYMMQYFAYPVSDGRLSVQSENVIKNYQLDGRNRLDMYNLRVGDKDKSVKAEYSVPLKTGLYILRDKDDKIEIDLPISGDVNSPDFSYKKVIIKTLCNLIVKLAVSPLRAVASGLGLSPDELTMMSVTASQPGLSSEDYAKLDKLATVQKSKPEMKLTLVQQINWTEAVKNRSVFEMKRRYYVSQHPELESQPRLSLVDFGKINDIKDDDADFSKYVSDVAGTSDGSVYERALKVFPADSAAVRLTRQMDRRNAEITEYLIKQGVEESKVSVSNMTMDAMRKYTGKDMYKIDMNMGESVDSTAVNEQKTN